MNKQRIFNHWPVLLTIIVLLVSILLWITAATATDTGVAIAMGLLLYMFLFPACGIALGFWYGARLRSPAKWLLAPAAYLGSCLYTIIVDLIANPGNVDLVTCWSAGIFTGIACLASLAVASCVAWIVRKNRE